MKTKTENQTVYKVRFRKTWPAFLLLALTLFISMVGYQLAEEGVQSKLSLLFEVENSKIINRINLGVEKQIEILKSFKGMYATTKYVVRDVFELYASVPIKVNPDIRSISFSARVKSGEEGLLISMLKNEGYDNFAIIPPGKRDEYYPVQYTVPFESNTAESGFDMLTENEYKSAIEKARDIDEIVVTRIHELVMDKQKGILFIQPIYQAGKSIATLEERREAISGICYIELKPSEFMKRYLGSEIDNNLISYTIYEDFKRDQNSIVYSKPASGKSLKVSEHKISIPGREWIIDFSTLPGLEATINTSFPYYILAGGIIVSFLLFGFIFALLTSRTRALYIADKMTRSQRRIVDSSHDMICEVGFDGLWKSVNRASYNALGFMPDEMINNSFYSYVSANDKEKVINLIKTAPDENSIEFEARFNHKDDSIRWIGWSITSSTKDQLIYMIGRDITEKKKAEELIHLKNYQLDLARIITDQENLKNEQALIDESELLRSQLQSISGYLEIVISDAQNLEPEMKEFLELSSEGTAKMLAAFENMIEVKYSKISDISFSQDTIIFNDLESGLSNKIKEFSPEPDLFFDLNSTKNAVFMGNMQKLVDSLYMFIEEDYLIRKNQKYLLTSHVDNQRKEIILTLKIKDIKEIPTNYLISGLEFGSEIRSYMFNPNEFKIFIAKSWINAMYGSVSVGLENENLLIKIILPIAK